MGKNYLTTLFGIMAGVPTIVVSSGMIVSTSWLHILALIGGIGVCGLGIVAKDWNTTGAGKLAIKNGVPKGFIPSGK